MGNAWKLRLSGAGTGLINGLFGGGGGMVLVPALTWQGQLRDRQIFATSVAAIFPICCVSATVYLLRVGVPFQTVLPYLLGGLGGGVLGGLTYGRVPILLLKRLFGAFLLYGGLKYLL